MSISQVNDHISKLNRQIKEINGSVERAVMTDPSLKRKLLTEVEAKRQQLNAEIDEANLLILKINSG